MQQLSKLPGTIATFYSYKGGVGRSMALANVAVLLAAWGYRTLIIDWDLEAPGLENFFKAYINIDEARAKQGLIDILSNAAVNEREKTQWQDCLLSIQIKNEDASLFTSDKLFMITSGRVDEDYYKKVRNFDFDDFYSNHNGGNIIERFRLEWKEKFDFVLIDSRTGVTDIGGVCTIQMPDLLVLLFTPTDQGFDGIRNVAAKVAESRLGLPEERMDLRTLPVPTRMVSSERDLHALWLRKFADGLADIYAPWKTEGLDTYEMLVQTKIPYSSFYSFGEGLPVVEEGVKDALRMGYYYEGLAALLAKQLSYPDIFLNDRQLFIRAAKDPDIQLGVKDVKSSYISAERNVKQKEAQLDSSLKEIENAKAKQKRSLWRAYLVAIITSSIAIAVFFWQRNPHVNQNLLTQHIKDSILKSHSVDTSRLVPTSIKKIDSLPVFKAIQAIGKPIGMDISSFNNVTDWQQLKNYGFNFILIRATSASKSPDTAFAGNWKKAGEYGLIRGAFHYFSNYLSAEDQAALFIKTAPLRSGDLPPIIDLNVLSGSFELDGKTNTDVLNMILRFLNLLEQHYRVKPIIYAKYQFAQVLAKDGRFFDYPLWIGIYGPNNKKGPAELLLSPRWPSGWKKWTFWQFTTEATIKGVVGRKGINLDLDQYNGTYEQLKGLTMP